MYFKSIKRRIKLLLASAASNLYFKSNKWGRVAGLEFFSAIFRLKKHRPNFKFMKWWRRRRSETFFFQLQTGLIIDSPTSFISTICRLLGIWCHVNPHQIKPHTRSLTRLVRFKLLFTFQSRAKVGRARVLYHQSTTVDLMLLLLLLLLLLP